MGWTDQLLTGLAGYLHDEGAGTYRESAPYVAGDLRPIFLEQSPDSPDVTITLTCYPVSSDPDLNDVVQGVQVRTRGARDSGVDSSDASDAVFERLHGVEGVDLGTADQPVWVVRIQHVSGVYLGEDPTGRPERTDNYYVTSNRPTPHRPD